MPNGACFPVRPMRKALLLLLACSSLLGSVVVDVCSSCLQTVGVCYRLVQGMVLRECPSTICMLVVTLVPHHLLVRLLVFLIPTVIRPCLASVSTNVIQGSVADQEAGAIHYMGKDNLLVAHGTTCSMAGFLADLAFFGTGSLLTLRVGLLAAAMMTLLDLWMQDSASVVVGFLWLGLGLDLFVSVRNSSPGGVLHRCRT